MIASLSPPIHSLEIIGSTIVLDTAGLGGGGGGGDGWGVLKMLDRKRKAKVLGT